MIVAMTVHLRILRAEARKWRIRGIESKEKGQTDEVIEACQLEWKSRLSGWFYQVASDFDQLPSAEDLVDWALEFGILDEGEEDIGLDLAQGAINFILKYESPTI